jgi:tetratricopeptide (TPR) repeat protein
VFARALRLFLRVCGLAVACPLAAAAGNSASPTAALERSLAEAEAALQRGDFAAAEKGYDAAQFEGYLLLGTLDAIAGRHDAARGALAEARSHADTPERQLAFATACLETGDASGARGALESVVAAQPANGPALRLLARVLIADGAIDDALAKLAAAETRTADDPELAYHLAVDYLRLKRPEDAARLFAAVAKARPMAVTRVLIGRAYRDASEYDRARVELRAALAQDPAVRHAHYYLGMILRADPRTGPERLEQAAAEFRLELKLAPKDGLANDQLGLALLESDRFAEALPPLESAVRAEPRPLYLYHLGRTLLALERDAEAEAAFRRALSLASPGETELDKMHYQLGLTLRRLGRTDEAAAAFEEARKAAAARDAVDAHAPLLEPSILAELPEAARVELAARVRTALARAFLNLGIVEAQASRFDKAAAFFERAASLDATLPQLPASLGIAYFNGRQFAKATLPLQTASDADPTDAGIRRMLAIAYLNTRDFAKAAALLQDDPQREADPSLDFAYAMALVKSDRSVEAEPTFARLFAKHGSSPELSVLVGQAHAQQGDYDGAIATLQHALEVKPDVREANGTLGVIYLKQGRLPEAEAAFKAELATHPEDALTRHNLGNVLDLQGRPAEALDALRRVVAEHPEYVDSRYLTGKILLAQGDVAGALEALRTAAQMAPEDANVHYQLAQAYQKSGQAAEAEAEFESYRKLKDTKRGATP